MGTKTSGPWMNWRCTHAATRLAVPVLFLCSLLAVSQPPRHHSPARRTLRTVYDLYSLSKEEAGMELPILLEGEVTYSDSEWGLLFLHDRTGSTYVDVHGINIRYPLGTRIRVKAVTGSRTGEPLIAHPKITVLGQGAIPDAVPETVADLFGGAGESKFVVTEGVLHACEGGQKRVCFRIYDGDAWAWLYVPEPASDAAHSLVGATVRVRGVVAHHFDAEGKTTDTQLFVSSLKEILLEKHLSGGRRILHTIQEVFGLSRAEAKKALPIDLDAVATYSDPSWGLLFVRDATDQTFIDMHGTNASYPLGTRIRVEAVSDASEDGPVIAHPKITVMGRGEVPNADRKSVAELDGSEVESHFVTVEGMLHPCDAGWDHVCFRIYDGKRMAWVVVPQLDSPASQGMMGALARVKGVVGRHLDAAGKRIAAQLFVDTLNNIEVEVPPLPNTFSSSSSPTLIGSLRASEADERFVKPVHVRGAVTWESPRRFSIQDSSGMVFVGTLKNVAFPIGNTVDAIGFPCHGPFGLELSDSVVHPANGQQSAAAIAPVETSATEIVRHFLSGRRVRLKARLISQRADATEFVYELEDGQQRFTAMLPRTDSRGEIVGLEPDSILQLTGVAVIQNGSPAWAQSLLVLIDSPSAIVVQVGNSWLTLRRGLFILAGMIFCVVTPLIWATVLRRTVRRQTAIIRAKLENELHLETKYRRLFERNLAAVYTWRADGTIVDCNMAFARLLGFHLREEVIGRSYWDFEIDPVQQERFRHAIPEEASSNRDAKLRRDDNVTVHLLKNITPVETPEGVVYETTAIDVTELRQNEAALQKARDAAVYESLNDPLTGLPNRKLLLETLSALLARARGDGSKIALLYIDLDGFKLVNDSLGHRIGDSMLVQVAASLRSWVREGDFLARLGGDEFMVILDRLRAREDATRVAADLLNAISHPFRVEGHALAIGASIGISIFPEDGTEAEELIQDADSAMYAAKREGKNRAMAYTSEMGLLVQERLSLENLLRGAVARREIFLHYQPEFDVADRRLLRFEALARWTHPNLGAIPPLKFIPIAEESGMIDALGAYIMEEACAEAVRWQSRTSYPIQVAVNVSSIQFRRRGFVEEVFSILDRTGLPPDLLQIELTESVMLTGTNGTAEIMNRLRDLGISLAIDDFGTGYSSLSYLPSLPFDFLKIDASFVRNMDAGSESEPMIRTLVALAHNFGMRVIVEGVEKPEQLELIKEFGANEAQGYLLGRPTPAPMQLLPQRSSLEEEAVAES